MNEIDWQVASLATGLFVAWNAFLVGVIKLLISRAFRDGERRLERLEETQAREAGKREALEAAFRDHLAEMPMIYVQREDWIRLGTTIDAKLDKLWEKLDRMKDGRDARN